MQALKPLWRSKWFLLLALAILLAAIGWLSPGEARRALANSVLLAVGTALIALPMGTLLALLIARFELVGRRAAAVCLGVLLFLPLHVQLAGWDAVFGKLGWFSLAQGSLSEPFLFGMRGAIFVHGM